MDARAHDGPTRVGVINRAINMAIRPMNDMAQWGVPDRWSAPLATLASGRSDCEDYAIAKYVALREAGVAEDSVRLVIVRDLANGEDHAVVAARLNERWIVLDKRCLTLVVDTDMPRVRPLFVFDRDGVKRAGSGSATEPDAGRRRRGRTVRTRALDFPAIGSLRVGQRLQAQRRGVGKTQHDGFAPRRRQSMLRRFGHDRSTEGVRDDQPHVRRKYLAGDIDHGGEK